MVVLLLLILAAGVTFVAVNIVLDASRSGIGSFELLGITLYEPPTRQDGILALCIIVAVATLIAVAALFFARGRRLSNKMAAIDKRLDDKSRIEASEHARASLLQHRVTELQNSVNDLTEKRDQAYEEMRMARAKTEALRELIARQRAALQPAEGVVDLVAVEDLEERAQAELAEPEPEPEVPVPASPFPEEFMREEPKPTDPPSISDARANRNRDALGTQGR